MLLLCGSVFLSLLLIISFIGLGCVVVQSSGVIGGVIALLVGSFLVS